MVGRQCCGYFPDGGGVAAVVLLFVGEPFSQKDLDEQAAEQTKQTTGDQNA